jgi:hypothetical protein
MKQQPRALELADLGTLPTQLLLQRPGLVCRLCILPTPPTNRLQSLHPAHFLFMKSHKTCLFDKDMDFNQEVKAKSYQIILKHYQSIGAHEALLG